MSTGRWTDAENDLIVADYFAMLADDHAGRPINKAEHNRALQERTGRPRGSIEYKHQNISAVLLGLGEDWLRGYKPAFNFQNSLVDSVARWLTINSAWMNRPPTHRLQPGTYEAAQLWIGPAPTLKNEPPPEALDRMLGMARKFDIAGRDERNRKLGEAGEERVLEYERATLASSGRQDLAKRIRWVSKEDGDGAGYDISSFEPNGAARLIEVKTTNGGWDRTPFHISRNELAVADVERESWCLVRLWNFAREPKAFELRPPLDRHVTLAPTSFLASFQ
ncbi:DUF3883 domain-containing protein [Maricaulis sp.]|uniref:DUF3883 domain-containing protein n=1 Tax=Maricaulis sp. TaxID=1486257 RepID=UPI003A8FCBEE